MSNQQSFYHGFDVLAEKEQWDDHTRQVVLSRTKDVNLSLLTENEAETLFELCAALLDDRRESIVWYVVSHFDKKLGATIGEGQRKQGVPEGRAIIRGGIQALEEYCRRADGNSFAQLNEEQRRNVIDQLLNGEGQLVIQGQSDLTSEWMSQVLTETVTAYYSHPTVWSEIGYAGPAYPRGYVRTERGLTDPWEARKNHA